MFENRIRINTADTCLLTPFARAHGKLDDRQP